MSQVGNHSFEFPASQGVQGGTVTLFLTIQEIAGSFPRFR